MDSLIILSGCSFQKIFGHSTPLRGIIIILGLACFIDSIEFSRSLHETNISVIKRRDWKAALRGQRDAGLAGSLLGGKLFGDFSANGKVTTSIS